MDQQGNSELAYVNFFSNFLADHDTNCFTILFTGNQTRPISNVGKTLDLKQPLKAILQLQMKTFMSKKLPIWEYGSVGDLYWWHKLEFFIPIFVEPIT